MSTCSLLSTMQEVSSARYSPSFRFCDPIFQSSGLDAYRQNLRLLRTVFDIEFTLHNVTTVPEKEQVVTRRVCYYSPVFCAL